MADEANRTVNFVFHFTISVFFPSNFYSWLFVFYFLQQAFIEIQGRMIETTGKLKQVSSYFHLHVSFTQFHVRRTVKNINFCLWDRFEIFLKKRYGLIYWLFASSDLYPEENEMGKYMLKSWMKSERNWNWASLNWLIEILICCWLKVKSFFGL